MAFSLVRDAIRPIRRDSSNLHSEKSFVPKYNTRTFNNGSRIHEIWAFRKVNWRLHYRATKQKFTRCEATHRISEIKKNTSKEILKTSKPENWTNISASLSFVWSEKREDFELPSLRGLFSSLIDIWKNVIIPSVSSKTLLLNAQENVLKL